LLVPAVNINQGPTSAVSNYLAGVACTSQADCWAVGYYFQTITDPVRGPVYTVPNLLLEHWDGNSWSILPSTPSNIKGQVPTSVTCLSSSNCVAVGYQFSNIPPIGEFWGTFNTLVLQWDGTSWATVSSPNTSIAANNELNSVTCNSTTDCWAVGDAVDPVSGYHQTLTEHWDGTSWTIVTSPDANTRDNFLASVTCGSAQDCWAVGFYDTGTTGYLTLTEHWDGTLWSIVSSANKGSAQNFLASTFCVSGSKCWAVGYYADGISHTLTEHWDGNTWSIVVSPDRTDKSSSGYPEINQLFGVTCTSTSNCWAVGSSNYYDATAPFGFNGKAPTLIEHWDGASWSIVLSPNSITNNSLYFAMPGSVACTAESNCWMVGGNLIDNGRCGPSCAPSWETLAENYTTNLPSVPISKIVSTKIHGSAGSFDIDLPLSGSVGVECRSGGTQNAYTLLFTFTNPLASVNSMAITSGAGTVTYSGIIPNNSSLYVGPNSNQYIVNLAGVANAQVITVTLNNVYDWAGNASSTVSVPMGVLLGDVNSSGRVDAADVSLVRQQTLQSLTADNFREDVNCSGRIDAADVSVVRQQTLTSLP
jgi:hypothetical protein